VPLRRSSKSLKPCRIGLLRGIRPSGQPSPFDRLSKIHSSFLPPSRPFSPIFPNSSPAVAERSLFVSSRLIFALHRWHLPIFHHWRDRAMDNDIVSEAECLICRYWPPAERADRRSQHFSKKGVLLIPRHDICPACERAFWEKITAAKH
jgi:hypothetical protein